MKCTEYYMQGVPYKRTQTIKIRLVQLIRYYRSEQLKLRCAENEERSSYPLVPRTGAAIQELKPSL